MKQYEKSLGKCDNDSKKSFTFCENANEYHIISAGSLLGVAIHEGTSFPDRKYMQKYLA